MTQEILAACAGIGLAASCGFRVFVPPLVLAIAVHSGQITPSKGFEWIGAWPAILMLGTATAAEVGAYYVPWLDHLLDTITTPLAMIAGAVLMMSMLPSDSLSPAIKWAAAIITGGGAAGAIQAGTVAARTASGLTTGGLANRHVAKYENIGALLLSMIAIVLPALAVIVFLLLLLVAWVIFRKWRTSRRLQRDQSI